MISAAIPFDIRDVKFDQNSQKTIPQVVGVFWAKTLSIILLLMFAGLMMIYEPRLELAWAFYLAITIQLILLLFMNENRGDTYCAGAIDGAIGLIGVSYFFYTVIVW